jgi:hypothetical protein
MNALGETPRRRRGNYYRGVARTLLVPIAVLDELAVHAARRGVHPNQLARQLLETVVDENMVDAVLDDVDILEAAA